VVTNGRSAQMSLWNEPGAPQRPNGILQNSNSPYPEPGQKAVLGWSSGCTGSCQYPLLRLKVENIMDPINLYPEFHLAVGENKHLKQFSCQVLDSQHRA